MERERSVFSGGAWVPVIVTLTVLIGALSLSDHGQTLHPMLIIFMISLAASLSDKPYWVPSGRRPVHKRGGALLFGLFYLIMWALMETGFETAA